MPHERDEEMRAHLDAWKISGLPQTQYCQQNNIKPHLFAYYKSKLGVTKSKVTSSLLPVHLFAEQSNHPGITINLPDHLSIDVSPGFDGQTLQQVLSLLR